MPQKWIKLLCIQGMLKQSSFAFWKCAFFVDNVVFQKRNTKNIHWVCILFFLVAKKILYTMATLLESKSPTGPLVWNEHNESVSPEEKNLPVNQDVEDAVNPLPLRKARKNIRFHPSVDEQLNKRKNALRGKVQQLAQSVQERDSDALEKLVTILVSERPVDIYCHVPNILTLALTKSSPQIQRDLGTCFKYGFGVELDKKNAFMLYQHAAATGDALAQYRLAICYDKGSGVNRDMLQAVVMYEQAAIQGIRGAMFNLAMCFAEGNGVDANVEKAVGWYTTAVEHGCNKSANNLAVFYQQGTGVPRDEKTAVALLRFASSKGNSKAKFNLAECYRRGECGVEKNIEKAFSIYQEVIDEKIPSVDFQLARCYERGLGTSVDFKKAFVLYRRASLAGIIEAHTSCGIMHFNGTAPQGKNFYKAFSSFLKAAEHSDDEAQYNAGYCLENGLGTSVDVKAAVLMYIKSTDQGNPKAMNNLAYLYLNGIGVEKDPEKAIVLFETSAELNYHPAQRNLATCHQFGFGVPENMEIAIEWFQEAARNGNEDAKSELKKITKTGCSIS